MLVEEILRMAVAALKKNRIQNPRLDAEVLLANRMNVDRSALLLHWDKEVDPAVVEGFNQDIQRRMKREPVAYIIGKKEFMGLDFVVNQWVLIPRPDTEVLVETTLDILKSNPKYEKVLEIGVGSGAIAVSLAKYADHIQVTAVDVDEKALQVAKENAKLHGVKDRIVFIESDCFEKLPEGIRYDCIASNPPYINKKDMESLDKDVKGFEPHLALFGGEDGLEFYRRITKEARGYLKKDGLLIFEIGFDQGEDVKKIMEINGYRDVQVNKDLAGLDRVVLGYCD